MLLLKQHKIIRMPSAIIKHRQKTIASKEPVMSYKFLPIAVLLFSCHSKENISGPVVPVSQERLARILDRTNKSWNEKNVLQDLSRHAVSPATILKSWVIKTGAGNVEAKALVRNNAEDKIKGIKIGFYCYDSTGEPAIGNDGDNFSDRVLQTNLDVGKEMTFSFLINEVDAIKNIRAAVYEIYYDDNSVWRVEGSGADHL